MKTHKQLDVWIQAMALVKMVYAVTSTFPREDMFGLTSQMRRAAVLIPSNIAEGAGRSGSKEFTHFLDIARGSLAELDTQFEIAQMLNYLSPDPLITQQLVLAHCSPTVRACYLRTFLSNFGIKFLEIG